MTTPAQDVFEFWEATWKQDGTVTDSSWTLDALSLALELQDAEWSEREAGAELSRRCTVTDLRSAQSQLQARLLWSPVVLPRAICASRALWIALDISSANDPASRDH